MSTTAKILLTLLSLIYPLLWYYGREQGWFYPLAGFMLLLWLARAAMQRDPGQRRVSFLVAAFFAAIFNKIPTYDEIKFGTHKNSSLLEVNELFRIRVDDKFFDGDLTGNRTPIARMKTWCPDR